MGAVVEKSILTLEVLCFSLETELIVEETTDVAFLTPLSIAVVILWNQLLPLSSERITGLLPQ